MVSKAKLYAQLDSLEAQLLEGLVPHLTLAANGGNDLVFCVTAFNPFRQLKHKTDSRTEELIELGAQILSLKLKLDEPSEGTVAARICWYCREWGNTKNHHRANAIDLAKRFLDEIENAC
ncbi:hypothetical protein [Arenicella xantha]|uniref:Uncharacterized protein n=1 Tax=Arenicella xantha TaxID=644221 RepID=A0A395JGC9_9GAMM|nr:hypothetical protein [Arenicella xantha]RBP48873.1 hypothetical protein DFR28_105212 [Arenicella xantha]